MAQSEKPMRRNGSSLFATATRGRFIAFALVAVLARGLIPVGFMPGSVDGRPQLVICNGHMPGMSAPGRHGHPGASGAVLCPFAHVGGAAPMPAPALVALTYWSIVLPAHRAERGVFADSPPRHRAPRGPPSLI